MSSFRKIIFSNDYLYHICNRGVEKRIIFNDQRDYQRFIQIVDFYKHQTPSTSFSHYLKLSKSERQDYLQQLHKTPTIVDILSFCLMPNHFHFLLRQKIDHGISDFVSNISNSYAKYFNTKNKRVGPLYQGPFRAVFIESEEQLVHVSRYIHLNPIASSLVTIDALAQYPWSSLPTYLKTKPNDFIETKTINSFFSSDQEFQSFIWNQVDYSRQLEKIKHLTLED